MEFNAVAVEAATIGKEDIDVWTWTRPINPNYKLCEKGRQAFDKNIVPLYRRYRVSRVSLSIRLIDSGLGKEFLIHPPVCGFLRKYKVKIVIAK